MSEQRANRADAEARRLALSDDEVVATSLAVAMRVVELLEGTDPDRVAAYFATGGETDPAPSVADLRAAGWTSWYPVIDDGPPSPMVFRQWDGSERPPAGRHGIPVPPPTATTCTPADLDVVLVPLVLFGPDGARAGRGAGYYDRTFAWLGRHERPATPLLVGLGHDFQEARDLIPNAWDVAMDVIITPTRTLRT